MNHSIPYIIIGIIFFGGMIYASTRVDKTSEGFIITRTKTYYQNRIIWGEGYTDHNGKAPVHNTEVVAFGDGWEYSTTTDDDGNFKVEVKADSPFRLKASDGNSWSISDELSGVPEGTTKDERS